MTRKAVATSALDRFTTAQSDPSNGFDTALSEIQAGRKQSHWIWYILPQLAGLDTSPAATHYALRGMGETADYLRDPVLRRRLVAMTNALVIQLRREPMRLEDVMGSAIDARKAVSSMTLFREVARRLNAVDPQEDYTRLAADADEILRRAAEQGIPECEFTRARLGA